MIENSPTPATLTKEEKQLNKQLSHHVDRYSSLRDWSELALWLTKLKGMLAEYKGAILDKTSVLKKLSTSLNPSLPAALHESTLDIYAIMFSKFISADSLQYLCLGLFTFYAAANSKCRVKVAEMFKSHLPKFGKDIQMLSTGILITVLPSLTEMHEQLVKEVTELLEELSHPDVIGQNLLIESVWVAILRSSVCRIAGLKYISSKLGKVDNDEDEDEEDDNFWNQTVTLHKSLSHKASEEIQLEENDARESIQSKKGEVKEYCPHIETLVTNSLIQCIKDSNILVTKTALEFLYKYLPLKSQLLSDQSKMKLAHSILWLLGRRDMGVTRKINLWLFGKLDSQDKFIINPTNLHFIVKPVASFLKKESVLEPLKIIFNLYNEHDQLPSLTMQSLTKQILDFCRRQENEAEAIKLLQRLLDKIHYELPVLSNSLGRTLVRAVQEEDYREADHILQLTAYMLQKVLRPNQIKIIILDIVRTVMQSYQKTKWKDRQFMKNALGFTQNLLDNYKDQLREQKHPETQVEQFTVNIQILTALLDQITQKKDQSYEQECLSISKVQVKINETFGMYQKEWVDQLIRMALLKEPQYYLSAIEVIGEGLEKEGPLKDELLQRAEAKTNNCLWVCINKLWSIMSLGHLHGRVIPLLLRLIKFFPLFFEEVLEGDFFNSVELAITKFSVFWQLSPKYPSITNHQHLAEICKPGFFKMLNFLEEGNPLVKYNTKIWINECFPNFSRVLDPLLQVILQPSGCWYRTFKGQYVFAITPIRHKVLASIKHIHAVIKHTHQKFFKFCLKPLTLHIRPYYEIFVGKEIIEKVQQDENAQVSYLRAIFDIIVRFMGSKYVNESQGDNSDSISLACCDVLESLMKRMKDPQLCLKFVDLNIHDILMSLHFSTSDHILQIQFLNLLDCIFFQSNLKNSTNVKKLRSLVSSSLFTRTILEGLNTQFPYIKERFVEFINKSIPLFLEFHAQSSELISHILNNYSSKIMLVHSHKLESSQSRDIQISKRNSEILILLGGVTELLSYFLNLSIKPFEKEKNQNQPDSGVFSLYSWKSFVSLKLEKKHIEGSKAKKHAQEISRHMPEQFQQLLLTVTTCWSPSELVSHYKISAQGLSEYDFDEFMTFNKQLYKLLGKYQTSQSVETYIINLVRVLLNKYPREIMNAIIKNWASASSVEHKIKIIQILNMTGIPIETFFTILADTLILEHRKKKSDQFVLARSRQPEILQFAQFYTHYSFQNFSVFQATNLLQIWVSFLKFIKLFEHSRNIFTLFAVIELVYLFSQKNSPKEILKDERLKKDFLLITSSFHELVLICSNKIKVKNQLKGPIGIDLFLPLPTSVFEIYMSELGKVQEAKVPYMYFNDLNPEKALSYCRIYAFIILKRVGFQFLQIFNGETQASLVKKAREVFTHILSVVENKKQSTLNIDCASQVAVSLMERRHTFARQLKYDVLQIFNKDDFFIVSSKTLHCWVRIIDLIVDNNKDHDIFTEYLDKVSLASSFFTGYGAETKKKIKSFERICFILFAGKKDKYIDKAHFLIDKVIQVIKNAQAPPPVLILIFFCIRILILRTSPDKLTKLLANLWQLIMFLLASIFKRTQETKEKNHLNLLWAALKLIEMVSIMELNEFNPHQWIFFYDFIGLNFVNKGSLEAKSENIIDPGVRPLISRFLPENVMPVKGNIEETAEEGHLIIKEDKIDDLELLKTKALLLSSYLIRNNQCKMKFNMQEVEDLIENDFLNLDEFIFKFK